MGFWLLELSLSYGVQVREKERERVKYCDILNETFAMKKEVWI